MRLMKTRVGIFGSKKIERKLVVTVEFPEDQIAALQELCEVASVSASTKKISDIGSAYANGFKSLMREAENVPKKMSGTCST